MNKSCFKITGTTYEEYLDWCKKNDLPKSSVTTQQIFFKRIKEGHIVRDHKTNKLIDKKVEVTE